MKYRILSIVMIAFLATGFSWGRKDDSKESEVKQTKSTTYTSSASTSRYTSSTSTAAAAPASGEFPTELIGALAKGSEAERQARIESLKRLSKALSDMKQKSAEGEATVASTESVQKSSWRTSY